MVDQIMTSMLIMEGMVEVDREDMMIELSIEICITKILAKTITTVTLIV